MEEPGEPEDAEGFDRGFGAEAMAISHHGGLCLHHTQATAFRPVGWPRR
ncbi:hypothetical protein GFS31_32090 [Leptolyngbya sp. BL0902]|nr:hypothetical protein GFS31_32090 [Leptolyngbya sp. BL0902]